MVGSQNEQPMPTVTACAARNPAVVVMMAALCKKERRVVMELPFENNDCRQSATVN